MAKAIKLKQLSFGMQDRPGLLSEVTAAIAETKTNILSSCSYGMDGNAWFMVITDGNAKAKKALTKMGIRVKEDDVFAVELQNKPGELQKVAKKIADAGINIYYMYGTASSARTATCILSSSDDKKAIKIINR